MTPQEHIASCDGYLAARTGKYEWRRIRYAAALRAMERNGLSHESTVFDVGAGWTEFDYLLRTEGNSRCRYIPVDGCIDGVNLEHWTPPRHADFFVALELIEHLLDPFRLLNEMISACSGAVIVSTPNPLTTDVLGMDETHKTPIFPNDLVEHGFSVEVASFYGQPEDSLFAVRPC